MINFSSVLIDRRTKRFENFSILQQINKHLLHEIISSSLFIGQTMADQSKDWCLSHGRTLITEEVYYLSIF